MELLKRLKEEHNILNTLIQLFISTDNREWETVKKCFHEEVIFDMTSVAGGEPSVLSPQQIVDGWDEGLKGLNAIHHQVGNFQIEITPYLKATAFCYGTAYHYLANSENGNTRTFIGSYNFDLIKDGNQWMINRFRFNLKFIEGNPNLGQ